MEAVALSFKKIKTWAQKNKLEALLLVLIVLFGALLRLYRICDYTTFLGDEGRDALVWLRMVRNGKFTLIGPMTSIGNMYLGPLYYYLMLPFFVCFFLSPIGPSVGVALFSLATIVLIWWVARTWFDKVSGLTAALFYAISPVVIIHSRSSWNPNVMPFFALLVIWGIWQFWQNKNFIFIPVIGVVLSFALQSHYLGLLLIPVICLFWLATAKTQRETKTLKKFLLLSAVGCWLFAVLTIVPLIWFDLRHDFINYQAFHKFFTVRQTTVNLKLYKSLPHLWPLWEMMVTRLIAAKEIIWGRLVAIALAIATAFILARPAAEKKLTVSQKALILILAWLATGLIGLGVYKQHIYDHYFGFVFPLLFILAGLLLSRIYQEKKLGTYITVVVLAIFIFFNLKNSPLKDSPNFQLQRTQAVGKKIIAESSGEPFNLALIAKRNYKDGYVFFLELWRAKLVEIEPARASETITSQLFVVCEVDECQPVGHDKAEIANFGWAKVASEWKFPWGVRLFKLVHLEEE